MEVLNLDRILACNSSWRTKIKSILRIFVDGKNSRLVVLNQSYWSKLGHSIKKQMQAAPKVPWWHRNSATIFRLARLCMGLMMSQFCIYGDGSILSAFVVPKLTLLSTSLDRSAQPYSINFGVECSHGALEIAWLEVSCVWFLVTWLDPLNPILSGKSSAPIPDYVQPVWSVVHELFLAATK